MSSEDEIIFSQGAVCPIPLTHDERIVLGHGSGGKMTHDLISRYFLPAWDNPILRAGNDAAEVSLQDGSCLAISTDCHVVSPLFFAGGDIGRLAVCGTVNDLAMLGARPRYLTAGFILEEGLEISVLLRVIASMQQAAAEAGIQIIAGDTKVVQKNKADGLYITTTGVGDVPPGIKLSGANARPGDVVILSGPIGEHGIAVLAARGELGLQAEVQSDVAPLNKMVQDVIDAVPSPSMLHVLRDPTRGGLGTTLNEIARQSQTCIDIVEELIPILPPVNAACELLGFDPLYIANEGKLVLIASPEATEPALMAMRSNPYGHDAAVIGTVKAQPAAKVLLRTPLGTTRMIEMLAGELLPRIC